MRIYCVALAALFALTACSQENAADVVYTNGKIYTVNEAQPWVEVVSGNYSKH